MKNILKIVFISMIIISCKNDDDVINDDNVVTDDDITDVDSGFINIELTKGFLLDEKWYLNGVSNATTNVDLLPNALDCELDSFYIFEQTREDRVTLNQGDTECDNIIELYEASIYDFKIADDQEGFNIDTQGGFLLGTTIKVDQLLNTEFLLADDLSNKIINFTAFASIDGVSIQINYSLISFLTDRP